MPEVGVGVGHADRLGLSSREVRRRSVDLLGEARERATPDDVAGATRLAEAATRHRRHQHPVAATEATHVGADRFDDPDGLVTEDDAGHRRRRAVDQVEVAAADRRARHPDEGAARVPQRRVRYGLDADVVQTREDDRAHRGMGSGSAAGALARSSGLGLARGHRRRRRHRHRALREPGERAAERLPRDAALGDDGGDQLARGDVEGGVRDLDAAGRDLPVEDVRDLARRRAPRSGCVRRAGRRGRSWRSAPRRRTESRGDARARRACRCRSCSRRRRWRRAVGADDHAR